MLRLLLDANPIGLARGDARHVLKPRERDLHLLGRTPPSRTRPGGINTSVIPSVLVVSTAAPKCRAHAS